MQILKWYPSDRISAKELLNHSWLTMPPDKDFKLSDLEFNKQVLRQAIGKVKEEEFEYPCSNFWRKPNEKI